MGSAVLKRSVVVGGRKTSVSLEDEFWLGLKEIAAAERMTLGEVIARVKSGKQDGNLSSGLRLHVLDFYKQRGQWNGSKRAVLVVDDEPTILDLTASMLQDLGCQVHRARDGTEALAKLQSRPDISVLITDINMPGLTGYELAERARRMRAGLQVILLSGHELDAPGYPLIRKPFLQSDLTRVMSQTTGLC